MKYRIGQIIAIVLALGALWAGVASLLSARKYRLWNRQAAQTLIADAPLDLSRRQLYVIPLDIKFTHTHGIYAQVCLDPPFPDSNALAQAVRPLRLDVTVKNPAGDVWYEGKADEVPTPLLEPEKTDRLRLDHFSFINSPGRWHLECNVVEPAPDLSSRRQRMLVNYYFCGLEEQMVYYSFLMSLLFFLLTAGLLILAWYLHRRHHRRSVG
jgi:hypothetical protein